MENLIYIKNIDNYLIIDAEDWEKIEQHNWYITYAHNTIRCQTMINFKRVSLPRFINGIESSYQKVKGLDFRRRNIGIDLFKYRYRKPQSNAKCKCKGVSYDKNARGSKKYRAEISVSGKRIFLGRYETEEQAALVYNYAVVEFWDGNGYLNDIE
ncbi:AP2 domain-containing protein [Macrococcus carouselicus]|uniref:AP2 domain-containing protein n=1 Tax=Macrococcus carouselicus TaxID=69969 RepID=A0A9Q8FJQ0_9STAP|nr:AP2 domain-containing protein [Macrococcus carouselicus]TDL94378.1 AP2 domain-containing protein [Macrococcus carouselicus]